MTGMNTQVDAQPGGGVVSTQRREQHECSHLRSYFSPRGCPFQPQQPSERPLLFFPVTEEECGGVPGSPVCSRSQAMKARKPHQVFLGTKLRPIETGIMRPWSSDKSQMWGQGGGQKDTEAAQNPQEPGGPGAWPRG